MLRIACVCLLTVACAPKLEPGFEIDGGDFTESNVFTSEDQDGSFISQIQATSKTDWVYWDFEARAEVDEASPAWDMAFQRFKFRTRVAAAVLVGSPFEQVTEPPTVDALQSDGEGEDYVFNRGDGWYYYDLGNHTLTSRDAVYVVQTAEGGFVKLKLIAYYDSVGSSGYPAFSWAVLQAPPTAQSD